MTGSPDAGPAARPITAPEPTHACIRCGRPGVAMDKGLCDECNPLELAQPSATQVHGIAAVGIIAFVIVLAVLGRLVLAGAGPFSGYVRAVAGVEAGLAVTLVVANHGSRAAATTCLVAEAARPAGGAREVIQTPVVPPGSDITFTTVVARLGSVPLALDVECQSP